MNSKLNKQKNVFKTICSVLDKNNFGYEAKEENLTIYTNVIGEDLEIPTFLFFKKEASLLTLLSTIPFTVKDDKAGDILFALSCINTINDLGVFYLDFKNKKILFRSNLYFEESLISEATIQSLLHTSFYFCDEYNEKLLALNNGILNVEEFIKSISNNE